MSLTVKTPIGITPRWKHEEDRMSELLKCMLRYITKGLPLDPLWIEEYNDLCERYQERTVERENRINAIRDMMMQ